LGSGDEVFLLDASGAVIGAPSAHADALTRGQAQTNEAGTTSTAKVAQSEHPTLASLGRSTTEAFERRQLTPQEAVIERQDGRMVLERQVALDGGMRWVLHMEATVD